MKNNRLFELDALRGLAALAVVLYHYFYRYNEIYDHQNSIVDWLYFGKYGAQFFFVISGFVIYWTLSRIEKPADFIVSRFSRLYPVYWVAVILTFSVVSYIGLPGKEVSCNSALFNLLMIQEYFKIPHVDGVYWTLTVELTFYFWIFILYLTRQLGKAEYWMTPVIMLAILQAIDFIDLPNFVNRFLITYHISFFIAGICFYKLSKKIANKLTLPIMIFSLLSTAIVISVKHCTLFSVFYVVFFLAISGRLKFLSFRPFVFLGAISYSLYLLHQNIGFIIISKFVEHQLNPALGALLSLFLCILLASILNKYVEKPSLSVIRDIYKHNRKIQQIANLISFNNRNVSNKDPEKPDKTPEEIKSIS